MEAPCQIKRPEEAKPKTFFVRIISISPSSVSLGLTEIRMRWDLLRLVVTSSFSPCYPALANCRHGESGWNIPIIFPTKSFSSFPKRRRKSQTESCTNVWVQQREAYTEHYDRGNFVCKWTGIESRRKSWGDGRDQWHMTIKTTKQSRNWARTGIGVWVEDSSKAVANMHHVIGFSRNRHQKL